MEKIKVLMVDDEVQFRETTSRILTRRGYDVAMAASGEEALKIMVKIPCDVVVLDIKMPGMDGHKALVKIKELSPETQVIMLTGHGDMESARQSLKHKAFDYLGKPCDIDRLASRINDAYAATHKEISGEKKAGQIMIPLEEYTVITPDRSIKEGLEELGRSFECLVATSRLMQTGHRSLLVMNRGELVGILSIMDLLAALRPAYLSAPKPSMAYSMEYSTMFWTGLFTAQAKSLAGKKVADIMSPPPPDIDVNANLMETVNLLYLQEARRLAVRKNGKLIGVLREQEIFFELSKLIS